MSRRRSTHAEDQIAFNQRQYQRQSILAREQFAAQTALDQARLNLQTSQQSLASLKAQLAGIVANLDGNPDIPVEQYPEYRQALAARDEDARELRDTVVRAPFPGTVTNVPSVAAGHVPAGLDHRVLPGRHRSGLGRSAAQGD